ncbi:GNAT family N-acetyltransferase [Clostridium sartagoforme]|uniref:GNAT family N-acetyltransferase n=1 Tax=Clostridium sartagoforme TaxID=84031 RepID=A0A4S2DSI1_9CLOT|nr:GNAT family N-acetyltransferase [Clostridium sartagoforme]TGY44031.1 GNAT family N-acetyltransferase [Clostridium sartagoforme]
MGNKEIIVKSQKIILKKYLDENDIKLIRNLEDICIKEDNINLKLELEYRIEIKKDYNKSLNDVNEILYYLNDELIGYAGISAFSRNIAEINGMVHPSFRRKGIFTKIIEIALDECRKRNFKEILLLGDDKSVSAMKFIEKTKGIYSFSECRMTCLEWEVKEINNESIVVKATNKNAEDIDRLNTIFFGDVSSEMILPEDEEKNNNITYFIKIDDKIIGKIKTSKEEENSIYISGFGIIPEYRRKGYGRASLVKVLNKLKGENISKIELDVEIKNKNALNLYKSCGLKEGSIMNYYRMI